MTVKPAFQILDNYWRPAGTIFRNERAGAPSGYTFTDPRTLSANADQWVRRTGSNSPFWELTGTPPDWDLQNYAERLESAKKAKRSDIELDFSDRLTLGQAIDFGATGIATKTPFDGDVVLLRRKSDDPSLNQIIIQELPIDASDGILHMQARAEDRGNFIGVKIQLEELADAGFPAVIGFKTAENITVPFEMPLWKQVNLQLLQWFNAIFTELGTYKDTVDNYTKIEDVKAFTWTWQN